jgi:TolA-binding protein
LPVLLLGGALLLAGPKAEARAQSAAGSSEASEAFADALSLYRERLYGAAQEAFTNFRSAFPHHARAPEALFYEARALLALENSAAATRRLEQLQAAYPMHPLAERAQLRLGRYFFEQEANEKARRTLRRVLEDASPERAAEARFLLGRLAQRQGRPADALEQFRTVSQQYPDAAAAPRALYQVASVHLQQGRTAEAADALERLAQRYPAAPQASSLGLALAEVYFDLGRYGDVLRELDQQRGTLGTRSERARASFLRAEALRRQGGRRSEATAAYQRYLERFSESPDARAARYGLALLRYRQADYPRAAALFACVAEAAPDSGHATGTDADVRERAAYLSAVSRAEVDEPGAAAETFAAFAERFPNSPRRPDAQYRRGRALLAAGRPAEAARVLGRAAAEAPDGFERRATARYVRSRALQQAGGRDADALAPLE